MIWGCVLGMQRSSGGGFVSREIHVNAGSQVSQQNTELWQDDQCYSLVSGFGVLNTLAVEVEGKANIFQV